MRPPLPHPLGPPLGMVAMLAATVFLLGCSTLPEGRSAVDSVKIVSRGRLDAHEVEDKLATTPSPKLFGLFRGVFFDYEVFDPSILQRDLARVERYYRGHGFLEAHARAAEVIPVAGRHVRVRIVVDEGPPSVVRAVQLVGLAGLPPEIAGTARTAAAGALPTGARFDEDAYGKARTAVSRAFTDHGYA
ncbi:MAG: POTRA domain-containing protein, partial [Polyangiaceae bacterium]